MKEKRIYILILTFIVFNCLFSVLLPVNGEKVGTLYSIPSTTPTIDGYIDPIEWQDAQTLSVELRGYFLGQGAYTKEILMYSIYDETDTFYLAIKISEIEILSNELMIFFQTNETYPLIHDISNYYVNRSAGNDVKWVSLANHTSDMHTIEGGILNDGSNGGSEDFDANCTYEIGNIDWEIAIPFNSTDTNGYDINVGVGDEINFLLEYEAYSTYAFYNIDYPDWDYCTLHIGSPPASPTNLFPFIVTLIGLFATSLVVIIKQNKKK